MGTVLNDSKSKSQVNWFVMLAYKQEDIAEKALSGQDGLEYYIAKHYIVQEYHGKKKRRLVPCIPSIIFVHASQAQIVAFKSKYNFLKFVTWRKTSGLEYLIVPDNQMDDFIRVSSSMEKSVRYHKPEELDVDKGTHVRVLGGPFDGVEGTFMKVQGRRSKQVVVIIPDVMAVSVEVEPDLIEVLDK